MSIEFDASKPIYLQITDYYYQKICSGELLPGEKLPSVRETAEHLQVNPNTASRSYLEMDRDEVTFSKRGQGTFVTTETGTINDLKKKLAYEQMKALIAYLKKLGYSNAQMLEALENTLSEEEGET